MAAPKVLLLEDDLRLRDELFAYLHSEGFEVTALIDGAEGLAAATSGVHDLVILDIGLPTLNGREICRRLRAAGNTIPVLMLTGRGAESERVLGLELGADDYLAKPCGLAELSARVRALLRRSGWSASTADTAPMPRVFEIGSLQFDFDRMAVARNGVRVEVTATEFRLIAFLVNNPGRPFSREQLLEEVWGYGASGYEHTVNTHINRIRGKIEEDPAIPKYLLTVRGIGYRFAEPHELA